MPQASPPPTAAAPPLPASAKVARIGGIGVLLVGLAGAFAFAGGWLSPHRLTPTAISNAFEHVDGIHPGFRRNHAKGLCVSGWFESNGQASRISKAAIFHPGRVPVVGRFSLGGGMPDMVDAPATVARPRPPVHRARRHPLAHRDDQPPGLPLPHTPGLLRPPRRERPRLNRQARPGKNDRLPRGPPRDRRRHDDSQAIPPAPTFATTTFNSLNAFQFTNAQGQTTPVKWSLVPELTQTPAPPPLPPLPKPATTATSAADNTTLAASTPATSTSTPASEPSATRPADRSPLFHGLVRDIEAQPQRWHLILIIGQPGDPTNDATLPWPPDRERIDVGTLILDRVDSDDTSPTANLNFDPLILPPGIAPSDDPLLSARSAAYSQSFTRRAREADAKAPSALSPSNLQQGGPNR